MCLARTRSADCFDRASLESLMCVPDGLTSVWYWHFTFVRLQLGVRTSVKFHGNCAAGKWIPTTVRPCRSCMISRDDVDDVDIRFRVAAKPCVVLCHDFGNDPIASSATGNTRDATDRIVLTVQI